jgi:deoxyxylulose-5-phosphate synthase
MGIADTFVEHGTRSELLADLGLTTEGIVEGVRSLLSERQVSKPRRVSYIRGVTL